ncbi:carboxypeptidase regulatory-like domain-containing protein [Gemmatimonadota bacterium]
MQRKLMIRAGRGILGTITLLALSVSVLFAQLNTGKLEGTVQDKDTGAPLAGTQVTVEGTRLGNVTNADGYYFILNIPPGQRSITFTFTGYQKTTVEKVLVLAGQTMTVDAQLSSTVVELEGITISGESEVLMPRDNTVTKQRLTAERLEETPATRLEDLLVMEAGVQIGGRDAQGRGLRIRGGRLGEELMVVDGVSVRNYTADPFRTGQGWIFDTEVGSRSEDASPLEFSTQSLEEVDIITGGFQAEYGNAQSGIVNIVTKEGGAQLQGNVRFTTDEINPRTADFGYNQLTVGIGGPVKVIPNLYFHLSGELQGRADRSATHADEGFRAVDQTFVDRLNEAVRNDPLVKAMEEPLFSLEKFQAGREYYASQTGQDASLFTAPNPVRLPGNWGDRTMGSGKITYSPVSRVKLISSINRSRNQNSYANGWEGQGNYFQTGHFYKGEADWETVDWGSDTVLFIPQAYARKVRSTNVLQGLNWEIFRSSERNANLQVRYSYQKAVEVRNASIKNNYERETIFGWTMHDVQLEIERFPNREGPPNGDESWWPDGALGWKMGVPYETPFYKERYTAYYVNYNYLNEEQQTIKADLDYQIDRYNRAKIGLEYKTFDNLSFRTDYRTTLRDVLNEFSYTPAILGIYLQNRTDLGDFIFNYGLRYDNFVPRANWGLSLSDRVGEDVKPTVHYAFSPRFDVGFPVTDKAQLRFSYGVFTQLPSFTYMFIRLTGSFVS